MKKSMAILLFALLAGSSFAQSTVFDYLVVKSVTVEILVYGSTLPEIRHIKVPEARGRDIGIECANAAIKVVQEYEAAGWVLFNAPADALWILRKPKQGAN